jgi:hypothetical protein
LTENDVVDDAPDASVPLAGLTDNQLADEVSTFHCNPSPPVLVMVSDCEWRPAGAENDRAVVLSCILGGATLMVRATVAGLPLTTCPVLGSIAFTVIVVAYVDPPGSPVAFTMIVSEPLFPAANC